MSYRPPTYGLTTTPNKKRTQTKRNPGPFGAGVVVSRSSGIPIGIRCRQRRGRTQVSAACAILSVGRQAGLAARPWLSLHDLDPVPLFQAGLDGFRHLWLDRDFNHVPVALPFNPKKQGVLLRFHFRFPWLRCGFRPEAEPLLVRTTSSFPASPFQSLRGL